MSAVTMPAAAGLSVPAKAQATQKLAQTVVQYQEMPKDGHECDTCVNFMPPNACKLVDGNINPKGWCVAFAPKST